MRSTRRHVGSFELLEVLGDYDSPAILLLHGYGASASDLSGLAGIWPGIHWIFPEAPLELPLGDGIVGRAWFPIDFGALEQAHALQDATLCFSVEAMMQARHELQSLVEELKIPPSKLFIGGFSQGAVLATDLVLNQKESAAGLLLFSPTVVSGHANWGELSKQHAGMPFFASHGSQDPILPLHGACKLTDLLKEAGLSGDLVTFEGAHEIPLSIMNKLRSFLEEQMSPLGKSEQKSL